jgi:hypothetical protein
LSEASQPINCRYCEFSRDQRSGDSELDIQRMRMELRETLELANGGWLHQCRDILVAGGQFARRQSLDFWAGERLSPGSLLKSLTALIENRGDCVSLVDDGAGSHRWRITVSRGGQCGTCACREMGHIECLRLLS